MCYRNNSAISIFFDDGGVLNNNEIRGKQWQKHCGQIFSSKFGGNPEIWGEANFRLISRYTNLFWKDWKDVFPHFLNFYASYKVGWVNGMFEEVGKETPVNLDHEQLFDEVADYVIPKIRSAVPGVINSIKLLYKKGFKLYSASGLISKEMKMYLDGMGIKSLFREFFGPDLINTWKHGPEFYASIFKELGLKSQNAIVIDDKPLFLHSALEVGANVIQACVTGEFEPLFPYFVKDMKNLPKIIEKLLDAHSL